ncbi:MAG: phosphatase PAP2 family protein [Huintestinicola sp.]|uniref:phosphatase PAP2 family protein n=1 Tax=Huintestinicola sp. TaxID=2981661 RepID=UPI003EFF8185
MLDKIYEMDFAILAFIREHLSCTAMDVLMKLFTHAGNWGIIWIALTIGLLISKKHRRLGVTMAIGLVVCLAAGNLILKPLIARDRPFIADPGIILAISPPSGYSFPSGHSFSSFVSASILAKYSRKAAAFAIPTAILIAFSRLYFCVHFPTDVLCGAALGIAAGLTVCRLRRDRTEERPALDNK